MKKKKDGFRGRVGHVLYFFLRLLNAIQTGELWC